MKLATDIRYRKEKLKALRAAVIAHEEALVAALYRDFRKPAFETVVTEIQYVIADITYTIKHLNRWAKPQWVWPSLLTFPNTDRIYRQPYGVVLIIAPWNYPFQLALSPLVAAIAAGNRVVLKPSELTPHTSACIQTILSSVFRPDEVRVEEGDATVAQRLLAQRWDYIFFTGSVAVGKIVAAAAAQHLTPVTLELGGKSPCIVAADADLKGAARRIVWGKFINAGQTCIAPDYILADARIIEPLQEALQQAIKDAYGENPQLSPDYARIINAKHWQRLVAMLSEATVTFGGTYDAEERYIAPTLLLDPSANSALMQEEIFGPLLPLIAYTTEEELQQKIGHYEKPLALYVFSNSTAWARKQIETFCFGGGCINDTVLHFNNKRMPFGGVGHSGMGSYHGRWGFETFSHRKAVTHKPFWGEVPVRFAPYKGKLKIVKKILRFL